MTALVNGVMKKPDSPPGVSGFLLLVTSTCGSANCWMENKPAVYGPGGQTESLPECYRRRPESSRDRLLSSDDRDARREKLSSRIRDLRGALK